MNTTRCDVSLKQRDDIAKANVDLQKALEGKGLKFNKVEGAPFREKLKAAGFYKQAKDKFDPEAWGLLQKYTGEIG